MKRKRKLHEVHSALTTYQPGDLIFGVQSDRAKITPALKTEIYKTVDELNKDLCSQRKSNPSRVNKRNLAFVNAYTKKFNSKEYNAFDAIDSFEHENKTRRLCQFAIEYIATHAHENNCPRIFFDITKLKSHTNPHDSRYEGYTNAEIRTVVRELKTKPNAIAKLVFIDYAREISATVALKDIIGENNVCSKEQSPLDKKTRPRNRSQRSGARPKTAEPNHTRGDLCSGAENTTAASQTATAPNNSKVRRPSIFSFSSPNTRGICRRKIGSSLAQEPRPEASSPSLQSVRKVLRY